MDLLIRPGPVDKSQAVAIVGTSSSCSPAELDRLTGYFGRCGFQVKVFDSARMSTGYLAGPAEARAADLMAAFTDAEVGLIVPATGGKGAAQLLSYLDFDVIAAHPTVFTGMSDPSILLNALLARARLVSLHGPSGYDFAQEPVHEETAGAFWRAVTGPLAGREVKGEKWRVARGEGAVVTGRVVGGHLGTIRALIGTPYMPDIAGAVLVLEEVFVPWASIDQALTHLRLAGVFDQIAALVVGVPVDCDKGDAPDSSWEQFIVRCTGGTMPVVTNVEFGHTPNKVPLVVGGKVELDLGSRVLRYCEDLVGGL